MRGKYLLVLAGILLLILPYLKLTGENNTPSNVYFTKDISSQGVMAVFEKIRNNIKGKVGIKVHFGEEGNKNYLSPDLIKELAQTLDATLVETNVLYVSRRRYTDSHIELAKEHGFDFAPIDILDSGGDKVIPVDYKHYKEVHAGANIDNYESLIIFSHFKGHGMAGFGGAIKNVSMGLASIPGKMALHASSIPVYMPQSCIQCGLCVPECPGNAITINPLVIDPEKCIGCGKCIGVCPQRAFRVPWKSTDKSVFLERLAEYAKGISESVPMVYINVLANISKSCDCDRYAPEPFIDDIGILASTDIVAIEKASHDLVDNRCGCEDAFMNENSVSGKRQIEYAYEIGMGNKEYKLIDIDKK